jgi:hypothetical protein
VESIRYITVYARRQRSCKVSKGTVFAKGA